MASSPGVDMDVGTVPAPGVSPDPVSFAWLLFVDKGRDVDVGADDDDGRGGGEGRGG